MSAAPPKRERRKLVKPKFSVGSSSDDLSLYSAACTKCANDPPPASDAESLSDADIGDIVRRVRAFMEQQRGPCQEEDLWSVVNSRQARLVRASFGSVVACLAQQPGFHYRRKGDYSFLYYWGEEEEEEGPPLSCAHRPLSSRHPGPSSSKVRRHSRDSTGGVGVAKGSSGGRTAGGGDGPRGRRASPSGSSSGGSYVSALEELEEKGKKGEEERKRQKSQRPKRHPSGGMAVMCCQMKGVQVSPAVRDSETQTDDTTNTTGDDEASDQEQGQRSEQASLEEARGRERREIGLALDELHDELEEILTKLEYVQCRYHRGAPPPSGQPSEGEGANCTSTEEEEDGRSGSSSATASGKGGGRGGGLAGAPSKEEEGEEEVAAYKGPFLHSYEEEEEQGVTEEEPAATELPRPKPCCCAQCLATPTEYGRKMPNNKKAESLQNPRSADVCQYPEVSSTTTIWDVESMGSCRGVHGVRGPSGGPLPQSRSEAQIAKIVKCLKKRLPGCTDRIEDGSEQFYWRTWVVSIGSGPRSAGTWMTCAICAAASRTW